MIDLTATRYRQIMLKIFRTFVSKEEINTKQNEYFKS